MSLCTVCTEWLAGWFRSYYESHGGPVELCGARPVMVKMSQPAVRGGLEILETRREVWATEQMKVRRRSCWLCARLWATRRLAYHWQGQPVGPEDQIDNVGTLFDSVWATSLLKRYAGTHVNMVRLEIELDSCPGTLNLPMAPYGQVFAESKHDFVGNTDRVPAYEVKETGVEDGEKRLSIVPYARRKSLLERLTHKLHLKDQSDSRQTEFAAEKRSSAFAQERVARVKQWLAECDKRHNCLHASSQGNARFVPKRLLHIGRDHGVKLVHTADLENSSSLHYATLSHCWGKRAFPTLTEETISAAHVKIDMSDLTQTFQDAIELCRLLSIEYLWIDSWCIIQNSPNNGDWQVESRKMHLVYGNSYINIAAAASSDSTGLFHPLNKALWQRMDIKLPKDKMVSWDMDTCSPKLAQLTYERMPLFSRGWVYQELVLAPRSLIVTDGQMFWKCRSGFMREMPDELALSPFLNNWKHASTHPLGSLDRQSQVDAAWRRVAMDYSLTKVTMAKDRLAALFGLAARFRSIYARCEVNTKFVAGAWKHNLGEWLLWTFDIKPLSKGMINLPDSVETRFAFLPSWSWLSFPGAIVFPDAGCPAFQSTLSVEQAAHTDPRSRDLAQPGLGRRLRASALMFRLEPASREDSVGLLKNNASVRRFGNDLPRWFKLSSQDRKSIHLRVGRLLDSPEAAVEFDVRLDVMNVYRGRDTIECALVGLVDDAGKKEKRYYAMLVQRKKRHHHSDHPRYTRLGTMSIRCFSDDHDKGVGPWPDIETFFHGEESDRQPFYLE